MKKTVAVFLQFCAIGLSQLFAEERAVARTARGEAVQAGGFAVDLPAVVRIQGATAFFFTALDVTNSSSQATPVLFEYLASGVDAFGTLVATLGAHSTFHRDDIMQYLADQGFIKQAQANAAFGTLLITFENSSFTTGTEASASVRVYNYVTPGQRPSIGFAYRGEVLRVSGPHRVSSAIRNTALTSGSAPQISTNIGVEDVGINDVGASDLTPITIQLSFYDATTGAQIGPQPTIGLNSGEVSQVTDVWTSYGLPASVTDAIVVATEISGTAQIRGYASLKDINTNDVSFFFMN
ncbi:MAG TPA: hypothetical protein VF850_07225 [Gemmatimonadaceae bacterium]